MIRYANVAVVAYCRLSEPGSVGALAFQAVDKRVPFIDALPEGPSRDALTSLIYGTALWVTGAYLTRVTLKVLRSYHLQLHHTETDHLVTATTAIQGLLVRGTGPIGQVV